MSKASTRLQEIVTQLPPQQIEEVIDFAEFLSLKVKKRNMENSAPRLSIQRLNLPVIKGVQFTGDPLLRRDDIYDD